MIEIDDELWQAFEQLAKRYPDDNGVRMTMDLARWVREHSRQLQQREKDLPKIETMGLRDGLCPLMELPRIDSKQNCTAHAGATQQPEKPTIATAGSQVSICNTMTLN
ncbi:MAG: hypothetical protein M3O26_18560 [Pseudomonadota bacterium]|nr:hypothetical protein [Pseudomonadota bacterium]